MHPEIKLIAIDLDGTLLNSQGRVSERNAAAIQAACAQGIMVILATGKSRASATAVITELNLNTPGVFSQGSMIHNADGSLRYARIMARETAVTTLNFAQTHNLTQIAYCPNGIVTNQDTVYRHLLASQYHEPLPEVIGPLLPQLDNLSINKIILCAADNEITLAEQLQAKLGSTGEVTQAVSHYIEILPANTSKGDGLQRLLAELEIPPENVLAIGDGNNDIEMLQLVGIAVAMGNGSTDVKAVAHSITADNNHDGVAQAIEQFIRKRPQIRS